MIIKRLAQESLQQRYLQIAKDWKSLKCLLIECVNKLWCMCAKEYSNENEQTRTWITWMNDKDEYYKHNFEQQQ